MKKKPQSVFFKDILTMTETESRLSLGMTLNKTYHIQTTVNHHRFIKVWTSIADLPTSNFFVQTFFLEKVWIRNTLSTYDLDICPNFRSFFHDLSPYCYIPCLVWPPLSQLPHAGGVCDDAAKGQNLLFSQPNKPIITHSWCPESFLSL